jgi:hypothetical protein
MNIFLKLIILIITISYDLKPWGLGIGIGDWGLGIGDWGLGPIPNPQSPIPNPQSPKMLKIIKNQIMIIK